MPTPWVTLNGQNNGRPTAISVTAELLVPIALDACLHGLTVARCKVNSSCTFSNNEVCTSIYNCLSFILPTLGLLQKPALKCLLMEIYVYYDTSLLTLCIRNSAQQFQLYTFLICPMMHLWGCHHQVGKEIIRRITYSFVFLLLHRLWKRPRNAGVIVQ